MARKATLSINLIGVDEDILTEKYDNHKDAYYYLAGVMSRNTFDKFNEDGFGFRLKEKKVGISHFIIRCRTDEKALEELKSIGNFDEMVEALYGDYKKKPSDPVVIGKVLATAASISKALSNDLFTKLGEEVVRNKTSDVISLNIITESPVIASMITEVVRLNDLTEVVADNDHPLMTILKNAAASHVVKAMEKMHRKVDLQLAFQVSEPLSRDVFDQIESKDKNDKDDESWVEYTDDLYYM